MRWLVACVIVLGATSASAEFVMMDPPLVRACPRAPTWTAIASCLVKHGSTPHVVRDLGKVKLVRVDQEIDHKAQDAGLLLYVQDAHLWRLAGLFMRSTPYEVLSFEPLTVEHHTGYHLTIGYTEPTMITLDGVSSTPAIMRAQLQFYCSGTTWACPSVMNVCEVMVHGNALWTFRGTMSIGDNRVTVTGDTSLSGRSCNGSSQVFLGWTNT